MCCKLRNAIRIFANRGLKMSENKILKRARELFEEVRVHCRCQLCKGICSSDKR